MYSSFFFFSSVLDACFCRYMLSHKNQHVRVWSVMAAGKIWKSFCRSTIQRNFYIQPCANILCHWINIKSIIQRLHWQTQGMCLRVKRARQLDFQKADIYSNSEMLGFDISSKSKQNVCYSWKAFKSTNIFSIAAEESCSRQLSANKPSYKTAILETSIV